jgi:hypothetical protein
MQHAFRPVAFFGVAYGPAARPRCRACLLLLHGCMGCILRSGSSILISQQGPEAGDSDRLARTPDARSQPPGSRGGPAAACS